MGAHGVDVNVAAFANQPVEQRAAAQQVERPPSHRFADHQLSGILFPRHPQQSARDVTISGGNNLRAKLPGQRQVPGKPSLLVGVERLRQLHINRHPGGLEFTGEASRPAYQGC